MFFKVLVMKELTLGSKILGFSMEFNDLLGASLDLATLSLSFFAISMLLYGKSVKLAGLSHFWADFWPIEKLLFAIKIEPLDQIVWNFGFNLVK